MTRIFAVLALLLLAPGCVEVELLLRLNADSSGTLIANYVVDRRVFEGNLAQAEKNQILPLTGDAIAAFANSFDGVELIESTVQDFAPPETIETSPQSRRGVGDQFLRRVHYQLRFDNVNDLQTSHFKFADYLVDGRRIFAFVIRKSVPEDAKPEDRLNDVADIVTHNRHLTLGVALPSAPIRHNGNQIDLTKVQWRIPLPAILSDPQPTIIAWAELRPPATPGLGGTWQRLNMWLQGRGFPSPDELPTKLLDNPIYFESRPEQRQ